MDRKKFKQLLDRYDQGILTPGEKKALDDWYDSMEDANMDGDKHLNYFNKSGKETTKARMYAEIEAKIDPAARSRTFSFPYHWAAAVSLFVVSATLLFAFRGDIYKEILLATTVVVEVPEGKMGKEILPDGSVVKLRAGSKLIYNKYFLGSNREVILQGEGFFEVRKNPEKPFIVHSNELMTQVLGTSFNVKAIQELLVYEVTVKTGKVQVSKDQKVLAQLLPTERISISYKEDTVIEKSKVAGEQYLAWMENQLSFDNQRFEEIVWYLEKRFGVTMKFANGILINCPFSGDFTGLSLKQILQVMQELHQFEIHQVKKGEYLISGEVGCGH